MRGTELGQPRNPSTSPAVGARGTPQLPSGAAAPSLPVLRSRASALLLRRSSRSRGLSALPPSCSTSSRCPAVALQRAAWAAAHVPAAPGMRRASPLPGAIVSCEDGAGSGPSVVSPGSPGGSAPLCCCTVGMTVLRRARVSLQLQGGGLTVSPWPLPTPAWGASPLVPLVRSSPAGEAARSRCRSPGSSDAWWAGTGCPSTQTPASP